MSSINPLLPEASDPFFVPDRTNEIALFVAGAGFSTFPPLALLLVPLTPKNLVIILACGLVAAAVLWNGVATRKRRLRRAQQVDDLRERLLGPADQSEIEKASPE